MSPFSRLDPEVIQYKTAPANISPAPFESMALTLIPGILNSFFPLKPRQPDEPCVIKKLGDISLKTVTGSTNAIAVIDTALTMVASSRSGLGAIQNRLTSTVTNLNNIVAKTEQSRAQIVDADYTSETTALSKSQILQQASTAMLAQANKANQGVLQLLQG